MEIDVTGIDQWVLLAALHNNTHPSSILSSRIQTRGPVSWDEVRDELHAWVGADHVEASPGVLRYPDQLFGRPIKAFLSLRGDRVYLCAVDLYDSTAGNGTAAHAVLCARHLGLA